MLLVTGGAGFIGSNIAAALCARGEDVLVVDDLTRGERFLNLRDLQLADYMDKRDLARRLAGDAPMPELSGILHQGACADTTESDGRYMLENNFDASKALLHHALTKSIPLVYASSAAVYGKNTKTAVDPQNERPLNVYGYSKLLFDQYARRHHGKAKATVAGLRYFNVYGPGEAHKGRMCSMPYQLFRQLDAEGRCRLFEGTGGYADGEQRRDFVHVGDVVKVNLAFLDGPARQGIYNVGTGASCSFNQVAHGLIERLGGGEIEYIPFPESLAGKYQDFTEADLGTLRAAGYDAPFLDVGQGLDASIDAWRAERSD